MIDGLLGRSIARWTLASIGLPLGLNAGPSAVPRKPQWTTAPAGGQSAIGRWFQRAEGGGSRWHDQGYFRRYTCFPDPRLAFPLAGQLTMGGRLLVV